VSGHQASYDLEQAGPLLVTAEGGAGLLGEEPEKPLGFVAAEPRVDR
jgi:hypothetical protein